MKKSNASGNGEENPLLLKLQEKEIQIEMQKSELLEKQMELEESRDLYADLYDFAPNGYITLNSNGVIKEINYTGADLLGREKKKLIGLPFIHFLAKNNRQQFQDNLRIVRQNNSEYNAELRIIRTGKGPIFIHFVLKPFRDYRQGDIIFRASITDITAKKKIENDLKESEERFRTMAESAPVMIWMTDIDFNLVYSNKTRLGFLGKSFDEIKGRQWLELFHPDDRSVFLDFLRKACEDRQYFNIEIRVLNKSNEYRWILLSTTPRTLPDGKIVGFIGSEVDITVNKKSRREIEKSLKEKEMLLKEIHHRIKNNLQIVSSLLNLQLSSLDNREIADILQTSQSRIRSMAMIHEKLYRNKELSNINVLEYVKDLSTYLFRTYRNKIGNVRLELDVCDINLEINLALSLGLILNELITNALKYAFPNNMGGKLIVSLKEAEDEIQLLVSDNGIGLPEDFNLKKSNSLGLELVDSLVEQHYGNLEIIRNNNTEFRITLSRED